MGKTNEIKYSNLTSIYFTAKGFHNNYEYLKKKQVESKDKIAYDSTMPVAATNGFFAIELYLKLIYSFDYWEKNERSKEEPSNLTQYPNGHNLKGLFEYIDENSKSEITKMLSSKISKDQLLANLEKYKDGFMDWRYFFEKGDIYGDYYFISNTLEVLYSYCEIYMNHKSYTNENWKDDFSRTSVTMHQEPVSTMEELNAVLGKSLSEIIYDKE
ncbi:hypothetical protein SAMN02745136_00524 [Anaerocolumna jejuensis DSM 15929]|uniref:HEPN domain-containing protein n=1 Tax=Anaerocolumna jejuensis DSM 15929 TaxID=1121322 RepID=A0A1M6KNQ7_9FIRM|nr:hypothetical protein [Anaerocolumna jejuensis]SHJ60638.1 hypothetical protein SAMN02745136_00524 [Anaerocolumna jejuensis DSM 15929]